MALSQKQVRATNFLSWYTSSSLRRVTMVFWIFNTTVAMIR
jgi:hypothetical protein